MNKNYQEGRNRLLLILCILLFILFGALLGTLYSIYINRDMIASMKKLVKEKVRKKRVTIKNQKQ